MKKCYVLFFIISFCILSSSYAESTYREEFRSDLFKYVLLEDDTVEIVHYESGLASMYNSGLLIRSDGSEVNISNSLSIPEEIGGKKVTSIAADAFYDAGEVETISLPDSLVRIDGNAFAGCIRLKEILVSSGNPVFEMQEGVLFNKIKKEIVSYPSSRDAQEYTVPLGTKAIGVGAFFRNMNLLTIDIPSSVEQIKKSAFSYSNLMSVIIPEGVSSIEDYVFDNCKQLSSVKLPGSLRQIGYKSFSYCIKLESIHIPDGVTEIGDRAFYSCSSLSDIAISDSVAKIGESAFCDCDALTHISLPQRVRVISDALFNNCKSLFRVSIPEGVEKIESFAFSDCANLRSLELPNSISEIEDMAFGRGLILIVNEGSYAHQYCMDHGRKYRLTTE